MKRAEVLLGYMDKLKDFVELLNIYIDKGNEFLAQAQEWVNKILELIEKGIDYLVNALGGRPENRQLTDDHMFV